MFERKSGILAHPTSFPSRFGIGDFGTSAYDFVDFLSQAKQGLWQILPLTPTSFGDSPYQSFSTFALNHLLISPDLLVKEGYLTEADIAEVPSFDPAQIDYGPLITYKTSLYKKAFQNFKECKTNKQQAAFVDFCKQNESWLSDYALFVALKEYFIEERKFSYESDAFRAFRNESIQFLSENAVKDYFYGAVWTTWPTELASRDKKALAKYQQLLADSILYSQFLQYEANRQWQLVKAYAHEKDIQVIGDIPIFVAFDSADTWANPHLFYLNKSGYPLDVAGVPPDYFSATGQLWGNPLYNWEQHKKENYRWWKERIKSILQYVDIVRIDHFRGFEAYWAVPFGEKTAIGGQWRPGPGKDLFVEIEKELGKLPIIAEDLGLITKGVTALRDTFDLPGMKVLQFAFDSGEANEYLPHNYAPNCIVYSGTHDNDTTVGWYKKASDKDRDLFRRYMNVSGDDPAWDLIRLAMASVAVFAIYPIQDVFSLDSWARMNTPGITGTSWKWRYTADMLNPAMARRLETVSRLFGRIPSEKEPSDE